MSDASSEHASSEFNVYSDDPVSLRDEDLFSRTDYADRIADLAFEVTRQTDSAVIALVGRWGSGKTSMINFIKVRIDEEESFKVVDFNPWIVSDLPSVLTDFFDTLHSALPKNRMRKVGKILKRYARKVTPALGAVSVAGVSVNASQLALLFRGQTPIATLRDRVSNSLRRMDTPILVIVDDIDRLQSDELIFIFKLMRLIGYLPNVYYLIAYDETTLLSVLAKTAATDSREHGPSEYLEKMIQVKLHMPPMDPYSAFDMFYSLLGEMTERHDIVMSPYDKEKLNLAYTAVMSRHLQEPRRIRRFCAHLEAPFALVKPDVDFIDYVIIAFLRFSYPSVVEILRQHEQELTLGKTTESPRADDGWSERLLEAGVSQDEIEDIERVLAGIFPSAEESLGRSSGLYQMEDETNHPPPNGVGTPLYFKRYFSPVVAPDDLDDATAREALQEILVGCPSSTWDRIIASMPINSERAILKLYQLAPNDRASAKLLIPALCKLAPHTPEGFERFVAPKFRLLSWMAELASLLTTSERPGHVYQIIRCCNLERIASMTRHPSFGGHVDSLDDPPDSLGYLRLKIVPLIRDVLDAQAQIDEHPTRDVALLIEAWFAFVPTIEPREWLRERLIDGARLPTYFGGIVEASDTLLDEGEDSELRSDK